MDLLVQTPSEHLAALIDERHCTVRVNFEALLDALAQNDRPTVQNCNSTLLKSLDDLGGVVARGHWPPWLADLSNNCKNYETNHANGLATWKAHILALISYKKDVESYKWFVDNDSNTIFDVDHIIDDARSKFKIDDIFQRIIETLEALCKCSDLDSVKACSDLERVIASLKSAKSGSFQSQVISWQFARRFLPNLLISYAKSSSVIGPLFDAFEKTADELDIGLTNVKDEVGTAILAAATVAMRTSAASSIQRSDFQALPDFSKQTVE